MRFPSGKWLYLKYRLSAKCTYSSTGASLDDYDKNLNSRGIPQSSHASIFARARTRKTSLLRASRKRRPPGLGLPSFRPVRDSVKKATGTISHAAVAGAARKIDEHSQAIADRLKHGPQSTLDDSVTAEDVGDAKDVIETPEGSEQPPEEED
jgi:hypothetical protein